MDLAEQISSNRPLGETICQRLAGEINKLGFGDGEVKRYPLYDDAKFILIKDPYTGQLNLTGSWYDGGNRARVGTLQFNSDGTFYAEYDVVKPHPGKPKWFIEGVSAWGNAWQIKAELKLLPMPE
ncbi:MAG: hypothetical protein ACXW1W_04480 [Methylococcaceae bacterium]